VSTVVTCGTKRWFEVSKICNACGEASVVWDSRCFGYGGAGKLELSSFERSESVDSDSAKELIPTKRGSA